MNIAERLNPYGSHGAKGHRVHSPGFTLGLPKNATGLNTLG